MMILGYLVPMLRLVQVGATVAALGGFWVWLHMRDTRVATAAVTADRVRVETEGKKISEKAHKARDAVPVGGNAERLRQPTTGTCRDC